MASIASSDFIVWGVDQTPYGPIELPTLVSWVKDERVTADTWVFVGKDGTWQRAANLDELQMFFQRKGAGDAAAAPAPPEGVSPRALRRVKILAGMSDEHLERFAGFVEAEKVSQWSV